jgi:hypothetical protein
MFIKRLSPRIYDVFVGNGWNNWSRVRRNHWGIALIDGNGLSRDVLNMVKQRLEGR